MAVGSDAAIFSTLPLLVALFRQGGMNLRHALEAWL